MSMMGGAPSELTVSYLENILRLKSFAPNGGLAKFFVGHIHLRCFPAIRISSEQNLLNGI